jgi:hypothetical protein
MPVSFSTPYWRVWSWNWQTQWDTSQLPEWSLTETFERLSDRFWPEYKIEKLNSDR